MSVSAEVVFSRLPGIAVQNGVVVMALLRQVRAEGKSVQLFSCRRQKSDRNIVGQFAAHTLIHPFLSELSKMTPTRKATPMFHMAKAATMSIT